MPAINHGTCSTRLPALRRDGLPHGAFVTTDPHWAKQYALLAVCVALVKRGQAHNAAAAPPGLLVSLNTASLAADPHPNATAENAYILTANVSASGLSYTEFDSRRYLAGAGPEQIAEIAGIAYLERLRDGRAVFA